MLEINEGSKLDAFVASNKKAFVLFFASWCPYSRAFRPIFERETEGLGECGVAVAIVDEDDNPLWDKCKVEFVPTVVYFRDGKISKYLVEKPGRGLSRKELLDFLKPILSKP